MEIHYQTKMEQKTVYRFQWIQLDQHKDHQYMETYIYTRAFLNTMINELTEC